MRDASAASHTNRLAPHHLAAPFGIDEQVQLRQAQASRGLRRGMVGTVVASFGSPASYHAVLVPCANSWGIVAAAQLRRPRRPDKQRVGAAPAAYILDPPLPTTGAALRWASGETKHERVVLGEAYEALRGMQMGPQVRRAFSPALGGTDFIQRFGLCFDLSWPPGETAAARPHLHAALHFPRLFSGEIRTEPDVLALCWRADATDPKHAKGLPALGLAQQTPLTGDAETKPRRVGLPSLPCALWTQVVGELELSDLDNFAAVCVDAEVLVEAEVNRPELWSVFMARLCSLSNPQELPCVHHHRRLLRLLKGVVTLPSNATRDYICSVARRLEGSPLRAYMAFTGVKSQGRLLHLPSNVDIHWTLELVDIDTARTLPVFPVTLTRLSLTAQSVSSEALHRFFAVLPAETELSLHVEEFAPGGARLRVPSHLRLVELHLAGSLARGRHLTQLMRCPSLLSLSVGSDSKLPAWAHQAEPPPPTFRLQPPRSLESLRCPAHIFRLFSPDSTLVNLVHVSLFGGQFMGAIEAVGRLPFVEYLELQEMPEPERGATSTSPDVTLGAQLARWPLGQSVRKIRVRSPSLASQLGKIRWPPALRDLDLSFNDLGEHLQQLSHCDNLEILDLVCTQAGLGFFGVKWPVRLRRVDVDLDDLPERDADELVSRFPHVPFAFHDL